MKIPNDLVLKHDKIKEIKPTPAVDAEEVLKEVHQSLVDNSANLKEMPVETVFERELTPAEKLRQRLNAMKESTQPTIDEDTGPLFRIVGSPETVFDNPADETLTIEESPNGDTSVYAVGDLYPVDEKYEDVQDTTVFVSPLVESDTPELLGSDTYVESVDDNEHIVHMTDLEDDYVEYESSLVEVDDVPESFFSRYKFWIIGGVGILLAAGIGAALALSIPASGNNTSGNNTSKADASVVSVKTLSTETTTSSVDVSLPLKERLEAKLKSEAEETKLPFKVVTTEIGGGYLMGQVIYYPDDPSQSYTDYSITAPDTKMEQSSDAKVEEIQTYLKSELPTINGTIVIKEPEKLILETYQVDNGFVTILLHEDKPFAYVSTDSDMTHVNYVTTYYVAEVTADDI